MTYIMGQRWCGGGTKMVPWWCRRSSTVRMGRVHSGSEHAHDSTGGLLEEVSFWGVLRQSVEAELRGAHGGGNIQGQ